MLHRTFRVFAFTAALITVLIVGNCASGSKNTNDSPPDAATVNSNGQVETAANAEREVSDLLDQYNDALLKKDAATLDRLWADDLSFVNLRGQLLTKKDRIDNLKSGATALESAQVSEKNVRVYGNTAVATLLVNIAGQYSGQEGSGSFRITTVWAEPKGMWQMVAVQMTQIAK